MIDITLPDGSVKQVEEGTTPHEIAESISSGMASNVISAKFNKQTVETGTPLQQDGELVLSTWKGEEGKKAFWHRSAHVLAQGPKELYPDIKLRIGPPVAQRD